MIIDVYGGNQRVAFAAGHILGVQFTDFLHDGWRVKAESVVGLLPSVKDVEKLIGRFDVDYNGHVVVVPGGR